MKEGPRSSHGSYWFLVHHGITVSVCAYITGEVFIHSTPESSERPSRALQGRNAEGYCMREMDPGRYGLQQGWDNNSVIVVSSLIITYMG